MTNGNWEIGFGANDLDDLLSGETAGMTLWFLAGYLKGISDSHELHNGMRRMTLEPREDGSWQLHSKQVDGDDAPR
jgi:hypothetical protein